MRKTVETVYEVIVLTRTTRLKPGVNESAT